MKLFEITRKRQLNENMVWISIYAPLVAKHARPGQFVILRTDEYGERVPLTMAGHDEEAGTVDIIFAAVGRSSAMMFNMEEGDCFADVVGPLGKPTHMEGLKRVCIVGGGTGNALAYPLATGMKKAGIEVDMISGFKSKDYVILEDEFRAGVDRLFVVTDDGSYGRKGVVTLPLQEALEAGEGYDEVITIGPLIMMKFVVATTKPFGVKTTVSMNPIMIDGTGMCGGCRLTVGGKVKFACVDGPDFDGFQVDFDEAMSRGASYRDFEKHAYDEACNLFKKEVE